MNEKRSTERVALPLKAEVMDPRTKRVIARTARIQNISRTGFLIETEVPLHPKTKYIFKIFLNVLQSISLEGTIVHIRKDTYFQRSGASVQPLSMGDRLQFNDFLMDQVASLKRRYRFYAVGAGEILFLIAAMVLSVPITTAAAVAIVATLLLMVWVPF